MPEIKDFPFRKTERQSEKIKRMLMNTKFSYLYRDACNYKIFYDVVVSGVLLVNDILPFLRDSILFVPSKVGMVDLQPEDWTVDDHPWHEVENLQGTSEEPTTGLTADQLREQFKIAHVNDWYGY